MRVFGEVEWLIESAEGRKACQLSIRRAGQQLVLDTKSGVQALLGEVLNDLFQKEGLPPIAS